MENERRLSIYLALIICAIAILSCNLPFGTDLPTVATIVVETPVLDIEEFTEELGTEIADELDNPDMQTPETSDLSEDDVNVEAGDEPDEQSNASFSGTHFQDAETFYTLQYPEGWIVQKSGSQQQFCTDAQAGTCFAVALLIKQVSPVAMKEMDTNWLSLNLQGYQEFEENQVQVDGLPAIHVEHAYRYNDTNFQGFMLLVVRNRIGFELMAWAPENEYPSVRKTLLEIARSFHLLTQPQSPLYSDWKTYSSDHLNFHYLPGSWVEDKIQAIASDHEWAYQQVQYTLGVSFSDQISYYLYTTPESLYQSTYRDSGFAINEFNEVHTLWRSPDDHQTLGHEMTHVITYQTIGNPSEALLGEGIAVCLDQSGRDYRQIGKDWKDSGSLIPLRDMLGDTWFSHDSKIAYQESGSFACFLLDRYGAEKFNQLYSQSDFLAGIQLTLNTDLDRLDQDWYTWLDGN